LTTHLKEKEEKILKILEALREDAEKGTPIIVEGKKDIAALQALGVEGKILTVKTGGKSFLDVISEIEQLNAREAVLFLDFDRRGIEGTKRLKQSLEHVGVKPNVKFWMALSGLVGKEIQCVESLKGYLTTLRNKAGKSKLISTRA
jgi:2,5-diamino-6-(ribosylamino)-4(3H)-pyrimidinone 5'-phosphate reductase